MESFHCLAFRPRIEAGSEADDMALLRCNECGKEVSSQAKVCPHCGSIGFGSTRRKEFSLFHKVGAAALVIVVIVGQLSNSDKKPSADTDKDATRRERVAQIEREVAGIPSAAKPIPASRPVAPAPPAPTPEPLPDLATVGKAEWPKELALREAITFALHKKGGSLMETSVPAGLRLSARVENIPRL